MYQIKTFNAIAPEGLQRLNKEKYAINESDEPEGILLRSQKLHDYPFPKSVLGIARAGAMGPNTERIRCRGTGRSQQKAIRRYGTRRQKAWCGWVRLDWCHGR